MINHDLASIWQQWLNVNVNYIIKSLKNQRLRPKFLMLK